MKILCTRIVDKSGSRTAHSLLEDAYAALYGGAMPEIKRTPNGKPYFPARPDIHFSLSHARTHVLCAFSDSAVGADIESPRLISERAVRFFGSSEELSMFDPLDLWVLKESCIKLIGSTLMHAKSIRFKYENDEITSSGISSFSKLYSIDDCRAAVSSFENNLAESIDYWNLEAQA